MMGKDILNGGKEAASLRIYTILFCLFFGFFVGFICFFFMFFFMRTGRQGRHTHMGRMGPTHGRKPKNSKKGRREAPIFVNGHLKGAVGPIRPWALANLVTALPRCCLRPLECAKPLLQCSHSYGPYVVALVCSHVSISITFLGKHLWTVIAFKSGWKMCFAMQTKN